MAWRMKYLFIDRDGTIIKDIPYNADPTLIEFMPEAIEGLRAFQTNGYEIIIITNQAGIALGKFTYSEYYEMEFALEALLAAKGIRVLCTLHCPHHPEGINVYGKICKCRKPGAGMIEMYPERIDSYMIGDRDTDIEAGKAAGCTSFKVTTRTSILDIANKIFTPKEQDVIKRKPGRPRKS